MCGVAGFLQPGGFSAERSSAIAQAMASAIAHRGPDDSGVWADGGAGIALGHRRLSVLDISPAGHQPMVSASGRFVIAFNGEIYNHMELRNELDEQPWRGHSDTETLLAGIEAWGLTRTLKKSVGMFALALWDRATRELTLARDRLGEKPLYYGWQEGAFLFGSELKALRAHPSFRDEIARDVIPLYLRHGAIPSPYSIYRGIRKLTPGTLLVVRLDLSRGVLPEPLPFWSLEEVITAGRTRPFEGDEPEALAELERLLGRAVSLQRVADVPLGAFLSGGIDSSLVTALMQAQSARPVKTFTIGFHEPNYNGANLANAVAQHLRTDHTELYVSPQEAMGVIPKLPWLYDEPFADASQIPTYLVARLARTRVTVSLSGDGGDELFCGYARYLSARRVWGRIQSVPAIGRQVIARGIRLFSPELLSQLLNSILSARGRGSKQPSGERLYALAKAMECQLPDQFYRLMISQWREPMKISRSEQEPLPAVAERERWLRIATFEEQMMCADALRYLPDDILVKVDRAAMAVGLETRIPLLDHRMVEFAWRLPLSFKIRNGEGKWLLRQLLHKYVPSELVDRPKMGFGVPLVQWLRGPLREWAEDLLSEDRLERDGFFYAEPIRRRWQQHVSGQCNWSDSLWVILMFQAWLHMDHSRSIQNNATFLQGAVTK